MALPTRRKSFVAYEKHRMLQGKSCGCACLRPTARTSPGAWAWRPTTVAGQYLVRYAQGQAGEFFRPHLLRANVRFSGRSVIVVGPGRSSCNHGFAVCRSKMAFGNCSKALFIYHRLEQGTGQCSTIKPSPKERWWEHHRRPVGFGTSWKEVSLRSHPVAVDRAPTLHRLGIRALRPVLGGKG